MTRIIEGNNGTKYKFGLKLKERRIYVYQYMEFCKIYNRFMIAFGISDQDILDFEIISDDELLSWIAPNSDKGFIFWF